MAFKDLGLPGVLNFNNCFSLIGGTHAGGTVSPQDEKSHKRVTEWMLSSPPAPEGPQLAL